MSSYPPPPPLPHPPLPPLGDRPSAREVDAMIGWLDAERASQAAELVEMRIEVSELRCVIRDMTAQMEELNEELRGAASRS